jgi:hypothetical protein
MKTSIVVTRALVGITGLVQVVLGTLFWTGHALDLVPLHMLIGVLFVLSLIAQAVLAARSGAPAGLAAATVVWAIAIAALGMTQMRILPGPYHWIVRVAHLLTAFIGMGMSGALTARLKAMAKAGGAAGAPRLAEAPESAS